MDSTSSYNRSMILSIDTRFELNDGRRIPALGAWGLAASSGKECENAVLAAIPRPVNRHVDTAAIYGNEESVGNALRASGIPREEVFVNTKLWNEDHEDPAKAFHTSLKRLKVDYVDLYLIHFPVRQRNDSWKVMEQLHAAGRAKSIGVSNFTIRHLEEFAGTFGKRSPPSTRLSSTHSSIRRTCWIIAYRRTSLSKPTARSRMEHGWTIDSCWKSRKRMPDPPAQILIRWGLQHGMVVIPKSIRRKRIEENASVFDFEISPHAHGPAGRAE